MRWWKISPFIRRWSISPASSGYRRVRRGRPPSKGVSADPTGSPLTRPGTPPAPRESTQGLRPGSPARPQIQEGGPAPRASCRRAGFSTLHGRGLRGDHGMAPSLAVALPAAPRGSGWRGLRVRRQNGQRDRNGARPLGPGSFRALDSRTRRPGDRGDDGRDRRDHHELLDSGFRPRMVPARPRYRRSRGVTGRRRGAGCQIADLGVGDESYKADFGDEAPPLESVTWCRPRLARLLAMTAEAPLPAEKDTDAKPVGASE